MAAEKGRAFLLKIGDGGAPETFTTIGGMRSTSLSINNEMVDVTHKGSGGWREMLGGAGTRMVAITGAGIFTDSAAERDFQTRVLAASIDRYEAVFESGDKFTGPFLAVSLEYAGDYNGERTYNLRLESAGPVMFVEA